MSFRYVLLPSALAVLLLAGCTTATQALAAQPAQHRFADMSSFIRALGETANRKRARITEEQRDEVKRLLAATVGLSLPSVHAIKKSLYLVKSRQSLPP